MSPAKTKALKRLNTLWEVHDWLEAEIIRLERLFTDEELETLLERNNPPLDSVGLHSLEQSSDDSR
jgi:hypothetical protein